MDYIHCMKMGWDRLTDRQDIMKILKHINYPLKVCIQRLGERGGGYKKNLQNDSPNFSNLLSHKRENPIPQREALSSGSLALFPVALCGYLQIFYCL